jgi:LuxR family maltose regulon positive regulatory protein
MENPLLVTKLCVPSARSGVVTRPRLLERLQGTLGHPLLLVSAPAGFGKTTAVSEWVRDNRPAFPTAWLSLEATENEPARFWDYLIGALRTQHPTIGETALKFLRSPQPIPIESTLTALINELAGIPGDLVLVMEDYHLIQFPPVHAGLAFLLEHLPPQMHMIITTRVDPPLPLARYRARGTMLEIGTDDLRFTQEEAIELLAKLGPPALSRENVEVLNARAEGWAAGLKMALLSLRGAEDISRFVSHFSGSQRYVMDYLIEEVLLRQTPEVRGFLLRTSILEKLSGPLCDAITGANNSHEMLKQIEKENLFLVPLDPSREWYRYEHLFADLLRHQAEIELGKERILELQRRASSWCEGNGLRDNAINHALAAGDWDRAAELIEGTAWIRIQRGELFIPLGWCKALPNDVLQSHPQVHLQYGWLLIASGKPDAAQEIFDHLERLQREDDRFQGLLAVGRANLARTRGDTAQTRAQAEKALSLLPFDAIAPRANVCVFLGMDYFNRELFPEAEKLLTEACQSYQKIGATYAAILPLTLLGAIASTRGERRRAAEIFQRAITLDEQAPATALAHCLLALVNYQWNDLEAAVSHLEIALKLGRQGGNPEVMDLIYLNFARVRLAEADLGGAAEALANADQQSLKMANSPLSQARHAAFHLVLSTAQGDKEGASHWLDKLSEFSGFLPIDIPFSARHLLIERSDKGAAGRQLQAAYERFASTGIKDGVILTCLFRALESPTFALAMPFMAEALSAAKPEGYIRIFADEGKRMTPLLRKAISRGIEADYARSLLEVIEAEERRHPTPGGSSPDSTRSPGILSVREFDVLQLISAGYSNQEIAAKLVISLSTAKTHVHAILEKLSAKDRLQAINRARELKLL